MNTRTAQTIGVMLLFSILFGNIAAADDSRPTETITFNYTQLEQHKSGKSSQNKVRRHKAATKNGKNSSIKSSPKKPHKIGLLLPAVQMAREKAR